MTFTKYKNITNLYADQISSQQIDPFSDSVLKKMDADIKDSFTKKQIDAVINALKSSQQGKEHSIDIRGLIPLFFVRYYFVLLMGRDTRRYTICLENDRRKRSQYVVGIYVGFLATLFSIIIAFTILYTFKSFIGIDIFTAHHLQDFF